jgi:O-acetyl-ADP-ribose deacetylase (regulator of RNase III)
MLTYVSGNLFEAPVQTLVNTVNTVGVMGKGIALTFKEIFPEMFREYRALCEQGQLRVGSLHLWRGPGRYVLNFPTKEHWRNPSKVEYLEAGLKAFVKMYESAGIYSIAFPPLGCGNGELDFGVVRPLMEHYLAPLPITVLLYAPLPRRTVAEHRQPAEIAGWLRSAPAELPFDEVWSDLVQALRNRTTVTTASKGGRFEAQVTEPDTTGLRIWMSGRRTTVVSRDELAEAWKQLRDFGLLTARRLPTGLEKDASYVLAILALLPYVQTVPLGTDYNMLGGSPMVGLQLAPAAVSQAEPQRELAFG